MGKVEANHIDAGADQIAKNWFGVGGRSEGGDDLCAALGWGFGHTQFECHWGTPKKGLVG
jgi:hypothetical protein